MILLNFKYILPITYFIIVKKRRIYISIICKYSVLNLFLLNIFNINIELAYNYLNFDKCNLKLPFSFKKIRFIKFIKINLNQFNENKYMI